MGHNDTKIYLFFAYLQLKFNRMSYISAGHSTRSKTIHGDMESDVVPVSSFHSYWL